MMGQVGFVQEGKASFYADKFEGRVTASGERYSHSRSTCAHLTLPFGTLVRVINVANNQSVVVRVNDRGPFVANRIIDLSRSAAEKLGFIDLGTADVKIEVIDLEGNTKPAEQRQEQKPAATQPPVQQQQEIQKQPPVQQQQTQKQPPVQQQQTITPPKKEQPVVKEVAPEPKTVKPEEPKTEVLEVELYELKVNKQKPSGFAIQIGSYKELVNLLRIADDLKNSLKKEVRVQVTSINNEKIYRLMVGEFATRKDADAFKAKAAQLYPDCFIVELK
jgi:rare lipoprotein A